MRLPRSHGSRGNSQKSRRLFLVELFLDALRHHSLGRGDINSADLVCERRTETGEPGSVSRHVSWSTGPSASMFDDNDDFELDPADNRVLIGPVGRGDEQILQARRDYYDWPSSHQHIAGRIA
jgi:hypothetical protein